METKRERVYAAIGHIKTPIIPYNIELTTPVSVRVAASLGIKPEDFSAWAGNHIEKISCNIGGGYIEPGVFRDEYGVVWNRNGLDKDIGVIADLCLKNSDFDGYSFPAPDLAAVEKKCKATLAQGTDTFKFGKIGMCFFERAWSLRGFENFLTDLLAEPDFAADLLASILRYNLAVIDTALKYDIDGFYFGDDYGQQHGLLMSPSLWRKQFKPGWAQMLGRVKKAGKITALHSCGNITEVLDDLVEIGLDVYQTVQPEIYDLKGLKKRYGRRLTFWGGISTQQLLPFATTETIIARVRETLGFMGEGGGYIAGPTHQVPADVPVENVLTLVDVLKYQ